MASIYEIVGDIKALEMLIQEESDPETGELRELSDKEKADFLAWINENESSLELKMNNIYKVYCNKKAEADVAEAEKAALSKEIDRLRNRAKARDNEAGRVKGLIGYALQKLGVQKYKTGLFTVGFQATRKSAKPVVGFFNPDNIPVKYLKRELSPSAIQEAIQSGELVEINTKLFYSENGETKELFGVSYTGGETLVIR
jgi:hypothetical protein